MRSLYRKVLASALAPINQRKTERTDVMVVAAMVHVPLFHEMAFAHVLWTASPVACKILQE